ncbi:MAG: methionyl-tRNA formyltransferase [Calditrichia bacterium]
MKKSLRIVFMGTPHFAIPTLEKIHLSHHTVVGVVTPPDKRRGRGKKLLPPPVKQFALDNDLAPILQPLKMRDEGFVEELRALEADLFVVVAFRILPVAVFTMPPLGTINLHPSELPKYRGAAPLNWTIMNGETETAISTIFLRKEIDAGNIIIQEKRDIHPDETVGTLHDRFSIDGADIVLRSIEMIADGSVEPQEQDTSKATPAPKITKETCLLNFDQPAKRVRQWIHGLSPVPGAYSFYKGDMFKIFFADLVDEKKHDVAPGTILHAEKDDILIACNPGTLNLREVQIQGRKRLKTGDFLRGFSFDKGIVLGS